MIHFVTTGAHAYCMEAFLQAGGKPLRDKLKIVWYEDLCARRRLDPGCYILSDIERLSDAQRLQLAITADRLRDAGMPVLNHPDRLVRRYDLLHKLHDRGINPFRAKRLDENLEDLRFPVFLRIENNHSGPITPLIQDQTALRETIRTLHRRFDRSQVLVIEYCDTSDAEGLFRKYSAMIVGGWIQARHVLFARDWCIKFNVPLTPEHIAEERRYQLGNPHEAALREIFDLAGYDFGRIDYAMLGGRPVVWEINSNPTLASRRPPPRGRREGLLESARQLVARLAELADQPTPPGITIAPHHRREGILGIVGEAGLLLRRLQADPADGSLLAPWRRVAMRLMP